MSTLTQQIGPSDHVRGNPSAPVTLTEYGDFQCPYCGRAHQVVRDVLDSLKTSVRFVFRHFPLTELHAHALVAAEAAEAAGAQGRFWDMHDLLFEQQPALTPRDLAEYANVLGLDVDRFIREIRSELHLRKVKSDFQSGVRSGVAGTPTFFINGERLEADWGPESLRSALQNALEQSRRERTDELYR